MALLLRRAVSEADLEVTKEGLLVLPSILARQLQTGIGDYVEATFPMTNEPFRGSINHGIPVF